LWVQAAGQVAEWLLCNDSVGTGRLNKLAGACKLKAVQAHPKAALQQALKTPDKKNLHFTSSRHLRRL
jgi:hypothetical protein